MYMTPVPGIRTIISDVMKNVYLSKLFHLPFIIEISMWILKIGS